MAYENQWWTNPQAPQNDINPKSSMDNVTASAESKPEQYPVQYAQAQDYAASPAKSDSVDPKAFQTAINQMRTKMESNNKLINAKNATFKHMYDQPLTDEEKASLTPSLAHAISTGNRTMIDAAISDVNQQIKGYNSTIDTNLAAYSKAVEQSNQLKEDVTKNILDYKLKGATDGQLNDYIKGMGLDPMQFNSSANMRTDRNMNPTAMTTDVAKTGGLIEGVDYIQGDPFTTSDGKVLYTAKFLGDPIQTTIKAIDNMGFYTQGGQQRWSYIGMSQDQWANLSQEQKVSVVQEMYQHEGGNGTAIGQNPQGTAGMVADVFSLKANDFKLPNYDQATTNEALAVVKGEKLMSTISLRNGYRDKVFNAAQEIDPSFSEIVNASRAKYYQNWVAGTAPVQNRNAINAAVGHLVTLKDLGEKLQNKKFGGFFGIGSTQYNKVKNLLDSQAGDPEVKQFDSALNKVAAEIAKVYKGGASPTEQEIMDEKQTLSNYLSEAQINGVVDTSLELLSSKIGATADDFKAVMGRDMPFDLIQESARKKLADIGYTVDDRGIITKGTSSGSSVNYKGYTLPY